MCCLPYGSSWNLLRVILKNKAIGKLAVTWFKLSLLRVEYETRTALGHAENSWLIRIKAFSKFLHAFVLDWVLIVSYSDPYGPFCASWINNEIAFQCISTCRYSAYNLAKNFDLRPCTPVTIHPKRPVNINRPKHVCEPQISTIIFILRCLVCRMQWWVQHIPSYLSLRLFYFCASGLLLSTADWFGWPAHVGV